MKFLNKNAYVQTAIFGTSFCKSSRQAFYLVVRNAARVAAISSVSSAVLFVGKLFISTVTTGLAYYAMTEQISEKLFSVGGPTFVVFLISYFVSDFFMDIYDMGTTTILHCFIADEEMFDGDERYATDQLQSWVDKNAGEE
jgi:choline transporter-like protein 2/4/5